MRTPPAPMLLTMGVLFAFWAYCLFDFARTDERDLREFSRPVWLAILVFGSVVGGVFWMVAGRPQRRSPR